MSCSSSVFVIGWSALDAGHKARKANVRVTIPSLNERNETVLSNTNYTPVTAERWISFWGNDRVNGLGVDALGDLEDEALGAGTPLVCLYLLGYCLGKNPLLLVLPAPFILFCWWKFTALTMADGGERFQEMWASNVVITVMAAHVFYWRINKRTPPGMTHSIQLWVALAMECVLASTVICVPHGVATFSATLSVVLRGTEGLARISTFLCPFSLWFIINVATLSIQAAVLRQHNMATANGSGREKIPLNETGESSPQNVCKSLNDIIQRSMDLRITGLSQAELGNLAAWLHKKHRDEAKYIRFFIGEGEKSSTFKLMQAFHEGYTCELSHGNDVHNARDVVRNWVAGWVDTSLKVDPWTAIETLLQGNKSHECGESLDEVSTITCSTREGQSWWLLGAIAKVCDSYSLTKKLSGEANSRTTVEVEDNLWYALMMAALTMGQNPLAIVLAEGKERSKAQDMHRNIKVGCEQLLREITEDPYVYEDRGVIITAASIPPENNVDPAVGTHGDDGTTPIVTYSQAGAWQAELCKETVMLGKGTFKLFWEALKNVKTLKDGTGGETLTRDIENGVLKNYEKDKILDDSIAWSDKVVIYVDYKSTCVSLGLEGATLTDLADSAWQGWCLHAAWVVAAILMYESFPHRFQEVAMVPVTAWLVGVDDQCAHFVYIIYHLWRSPIERVCLCFPRVSDEDVDIFIARYVFFLAYFAVTWGGVLVEMISPPFLRRVVFYILMFVSTVPGLWFFTLCKGSGLKDGGTVVRYQGRKRGTGYEHRKSPGCFRPLGKDVYPQPDPLGTASSSQEYSDYV